MQLWLCPLLAFLLGSIPFGLLIAKAKGIDIRQHGSGNIGATNVLRVVGKKYGITCLILDALKGLIPTIIGISLIRFAGMKNPMMISALDPFSAEFPMLTAQVMQVITGLCAILGHNYSPWVGFKGGKGIATSAGVLIAMMPAAIVILLIVWLLVFLISRYVSLASIVTAAVLPLITLWGSWFHGKIQNGTWNKPLFVFTIIIAVLAIWKHRSNIQRLRQGTENRFQRKPKPGHV
ncbi:glycerol-3-phosphate 1-O-acyltransferase PlsY [Luteolibacter sp. SL250]|uniref:glycerol-3-phosphate 1-O-acyltransferase PlsY n=1 Tax=Luteolibacter sp. SL250 TaxID=2995170 RepID=UPI00226D504D|nr:glycerol-3-phosphate 1-O-acyltransferase PlsY [Luteolibacter sp. SL250]WAC17898.1 glycerol-3-phosphate 1-O-acyltransferase PlsY [Luteolibacter sp. SL250]